MKRAVLLVMLCASAQVCLSQTLLDRVRKKKYSRYADMEGYVVVEKDTLRGTIRIGVEKDELDYASLRDHIYFVDSTGEEQQFTPSGITSFGLSESDIAGDYVSVGDETVSKRFLKKVVEGDVSLFQETFGRYVRDPARAGTYSEQRYVANNKVYYLRQAGGATIKFELDDLSAVRMKDLQKIMDILPTLKAVNGQVLVADVTEAVKEHNLKRR